MPDVSHDPSTSLTRVARLGALLESAQLLHASLDLDTLLAHLVRTVMGRHLVARAVVAIGDGETARVAALRGLRSLAVGDPFDASVAESVGLTRVLPIGTPPVGLLGLGPAGRSVDADEEAFLLGLLGIAASGIANARAHEETRRLNTDLDRKNQELASLVELVRALARTTDPDEVARVLGLTLAGQWALSRYAVLAARPGQPPVARQKGMTLPPCDRYLEALARLPDACTPEEIEDTALRDLLADQRVALLFPLRVGGQTVGLAALGPRPSGLGYGPHDREIGAGMAAQAVVALENCWNFRETLEKQQMEKELALAAGIQRGLLPAALPHVEGLDVAGASRPARVVGGDYYDALLVERANAPYLLCVADVAGKGIAASLLMSGMHATLRALIGHDLSLAALAAQTNELLFAATPGNKYVTAVLLQVDASSGQCRYVSAGHNDLLVVRPGGDVEWCPATGLAFGMFPGAAYGEGELTLAAGDISVLYSDGVTEAQRTDGAEFGATRLVDAVHSAASQPAEAIVAHVLREIDRFTRGVPQYDDITIVVVKRTA
ncbi:MAG: SpoIIE family protein phosphatase [Luteitalea sp.]|nr:SpoIIE family protein phosphatase [Luteitalea sp.]